MAHYALLDENNIVVNVIVGRDEDDLPESITSWEEYYGNVLGGKVLRTSYNTYANEHSEEGKQAFRKNFAGIGFSYDETLDGFIQPKVFDSWVLDEQICLWKAPVPVPGIDKPQYYTPVYRAEDETYFDWNEETQSWDVASVGYGSYPFN